MSKHKALCHKCKKHTPEYVVTTDGILHGMWQQYEYFALCKKCSIIQKLLMDGEALKIKRIRYFNTLYRGNKVIICTIDKYRGRLIEAYCEYI